jgi:O-antigen ligase
VIGFQDQLFEVFIAIIEFFQLQEFFRVESLEEGSGRTIAWAFAWQEIQNYYFVGGGFGHDENVMRPNYWWMSKEGHQGGVHNSYLSMWFDTGILGVVLYFVAFAGNIFKAMRQNYLALAFGISILFNITYESWLVASLNPFTIIFLIILTIFTTGITGEKQEVVNPSPEEEPVLIPKTV